VRHADRAQHDRWAPRPTAGAIETDGRALVAVPPKTQIVRTVIVPSAPAWTFASLTPSISFALIGVVVGEFLGGESGGGLGYLIIQSLGTLNAADMMVALLCLGVIGIVMALGIKQLERRLLRWRPEYRKGE
jgi:NitT/TauT family transport system permease protein